MKESITVEALVESDIASVWEQWTGPEHVVGWNFASDDWHCPSARNDLAVGASFSYRMEAKDGSMGFDLVGTYSEIAPEERLAYALEDGRQVEVVFARDGDRTRIKQTFVPETMNSKELQRSGWQSILDNFKAYAER